MSQRIHVQLDIPAPRAAVFARLSDHARFCDFPGVARSELLERGHPDENGVGAVRLIQTTSGVRFVERIEAFEAPDVYRYRILECTIPMRHTFGEVRLTERGETTHVDWRSEFDLKVPLLGGLARRLGAQGFSTILKTVRRELR